MSKSTTIRSSDKQGDSHGVANTAEPVMMHRPRALNSPELTPRLVADTKAMPAIEPPELTPRLAADTKAVPAIEPPELAAKFQALLDYFLAKKEQGIGVAFSGGIDSTLVLWAAHQALGDRARAYNGVASIFPSYETDEAREFCKEHNIAYTAVVLNPLEIEGYRDNPPERCYICKHMIFSTLIEQAARDGFAVIVDGTNADDNADDRPGMKALVELGVQSPLKELGIAKAEIRELSRLLGLPCWSKGSFACLMTRFGQGQHISDDMLLMVGEAESYLYELGFTQFRVRWHAGNLARIELGDQDMKRMLDPARMEDINHQLKELGFSQVTLDLGGFVSGSMARPAV
ncbi:MAG: ATP-dependent sacrificial sulfur transferase LarE [Atopobiaceae bacterium]|nr:ATP-dependent sacrificial sulfur transferase LarE [Atopobiaceae bacterium]